MYNDFDFFSGSKFVLVVLAAGTISYSLHYPNSSLTKITAQEANICFKSTEIKLK